MKEIEKELILDLGRETIDDFEPTEKKPRIFVHKRRPLSQKKGLKDKYGKPKQTTKTTRKPNAKATKPKTSKKTTKRDENRNFRK
jgi:ATP-dependent RNA helicase RhlE